MRGITSFKTVVAFFILSAFVIGCQNISADQKTAARDGVFIHISHGPAHPHRVLMGLNMAVLMSEDKDVVVYFDIDGVKDVLKDADDLTFSHFPSSKTQLQKLLEQGVSVYACPGCLKAFDKTGDDLMAGVKVAEKAGFFDFTKGRILTLDY